MAVTQYTFGNAIIEIHRPELTNEERIRREKQILIALDNFGKAMVDAERNRQKNVG